MTASQGCPKPPEHAAGGQAMQALRVGVLGAGHFGQFHARKLAKFRLLSGIFDVSAERATMVAAECGVAALGRDALIAASDAVIVAAPTAHHHEIGLAVLRAGRHLFVEKPIAATLEQADEMIAEAAARRLVLQVGHIERYSAAIVALREAMGDFAPRSLDATRVAPFRPRSLDISVVLDLMIHDIDLVLSLAGAPLVEVRAVGAPVASRLPDYAVAHLSFANGAQAQITASRVAFSMERRLRLLGDQGEIRVDFLARTLQSLRPGSTNPAEHLPTHSPTTTTWTDHDSLEAELTAFTQAITHTTAPEADGRTGREALAAALQVEEALRGGKPALGSR